MQGFFTYTLIPFVALLLVSAQALWGSAIKSDKLLAGTLPHISLSLLSSWKMWIGAGIYVLATLIYFYLMSKAPFYSVQVTMTGLSIVFSTCLALLLFKEQPTLINYFGILLVLLGVYLILSRPTT